jgi:hypothetical protein
MSAKKTETVAYQKNRRRLNVARRPRLLKAKHTLPKRQTESRSGNVSDLWMSSDTLFNRSFLAPRDVESVNRKRQGAAQRRLSKTRSSRRLQKGARCSGRLPKTKSIASMTLDLPDPFGPTTLEKCLWNGPT